MSDNKRADKDRADLRKERVIHTRVPALLEQELKKVAESLKIPVSNVIRTILEDAVMTLDSVGQMAEGELRHAAERLGRTREALRNSQLPGKGHARGKRHKPGEALLGVVGFQPLTMMRKDEVCTGCDQPLESGQVAHLGVRDAPGPRVLLCEACMQKAKEGPA